ncbi:L,D-transpeptidase [Poritiphilus flavus]|uniref:L,D-transpeptidase family protein n=1 Tax=Poritiphilus flavus TaxID=2697053 RepID=A0A6L9EG52_9FLAO|nr:L,D-transpeptidase [Poritiphilus flavus]NAS13734.1 L,D-transpeptidase family protein [Poritiphilus flavus]
MKTFLKITLFFIVVLLASLLKGNHVHGDIKIGTTTSEKGRGHFKLKHSKAWTMPMDTVLVRDYFNYIDSLVVSYDSITTYPLSEHLLVRANPWIIDTLANTDYYRMKSRDSFVYDQKQLIVFRPTDSILIPDSLAAVQLLNRIKRTIIDLNIPEFKLRIYEDSVLLYTFPIRVGQNRKRYLKMGGRITDLRTKPGKGEIVDYRRYPVFYNPVDGKQFYLTKRDDEKTTLMPQIPWIETEINGVRNGQLIHPTTNPKSLGKASSNGCIGTREADAWVIYYHAPIGTEINIRYDLNIKDSLGREQVLQDIYNYGPKN